MKVLQINTWFRVGSTGKLTESIFNYLTKQGIDSYVMFGRGKLLKEDKESTKIFKNSSSMEAKTNSLLSRLSGIMYGGCYFSTNKAIRIIKRIKPDIIHIHCTNSFILNNYRLFKYIGNNHIKTVITLHAEYLFTGTCSHSFDCEQWKTGCKKCPRFRQVSRSLILDRTSSGWKKMNKALSFIDVYNRRIVSVSKWLKEKASLSAIFKNDDIKVIHNGINTEIFKYYSDSENEFSYLKKNYEKIFLYCTPNFNDSENDIKGGKYLLQLAEEFKGNPEVLFIVAGGNRKGFDFYKYSNIRYVGNITNQKQLAMLYSVSDATLMLSKQETYSLVTAESISCGTKVVGFKSGGPESIAMPELSEFYDYGMVDSILQSLKNLKRSAEKHSVKEYTEKKMAEKYLSIYDELLKK